MKSVIVIYEVDSSDNERNIIGVASTRGNAFNIMEEYYGKGEHVTSDFRDVRDSNIDFTCTIKVEGVWGGVYHITGMDFIVDSI